MTTSKPDHARPLDTRKPLIGVVGPCAGGKSTLVGGLTRLGFRTRHIAQEHSYVQDMWKRLTNPDILVFLDASYPVTCRRRRLDWTEAEYAEQHRRLLNAREHADLYIQTDNLEAEAVLQQVVRFVEQWEPKTAPKR
jgi:hypothetical protein